MVNKGNRGNKGNKDNIDEIYNILSDLENDSTSVCEIKSKYNELKDFTSLIAWQDCQKAKQFFYTKILKKLPVEEKYNLDSQIRRASVSITANIAEGYGRYHYQEGIQFYRISRGSLFELKDHLISCFDFGYINKDLLEEGKELIETAKIILNGYINYIRNQKKSNKLNLLPLISLYPLSPHIQKHVAPETSGE